MSDNSVTWQCGGVKDECGCVLWMFVTKTLMWARATLCDPGVQSHTLDVSSLLFLFV